MRANYRCHFTWQPRQRVVERAGIFGSPFVTSRIRGWEKKSERNERTLLFFFSRVRFSPDARTRLYSYLSRLERDETRKRGKKEKKTDPVSAPRGAINVQLFGSTMGFRARVAYYSTLSPSAPVSKLKVVGIKRGICFTENRSARRNDINFVESIRRWCGRYYCISAHKRR